MSIQPRKFLALASAIIVLFIGAYYACFHYQLGAYVKAAWWVKNAYQYKAHIAEQTESPKIIIISGSNAMFGIDSAMIEDITGYPVINLAGHAALDLNFFYFKLVEHIGDGDIVVMPLEDTYYEQDGFSDWFINNMLAWGKKDYLDYLDIADKFKFIVSVPKERIFEGVLKQKGTNPVIQKDEIIKGMDELLLSEGAKWRGYNHTSLNMYGDMIPEEHVTKAISKLYQKGVYYFQSADISDAFVASYRKIKKLVSRHNGQLILTWPVSMRNKYFDLSLPEHLDFVDERRRLFAEESIKIECNPALFNFDAKFFFDTEYHLNKYGTMMRSENLAQCLNQVLKGKGQQNISYDEALGIVRNQEAEFAELL